MEMDFVWNCQLRLRFGRVSKQSTSKIWWKKSVWNWMVCVRQLIHSKIHALVCRSTSSTESVCCMCALWQYWTLNEFVLNGVVFVEWLHPVSSYNVRVNLVFLCVRLLHSFCCRNRMYFTFYVYHFICHPRMEFIYGMTFIQCI